MRKGGGLFSAATLRLPEPGPSQIYPIIRTFQS